MPKPVTRKRAAWFARRYNEIKERHPGWTDRRIAQDLGIAYETLRAYKKWARKFFGENLSPDGLERGYSLEGDEVVFYGLSTAPGGELRLPRETVSAIYELYSNYTLGLQRNEVAREVGITVEQLDEIREILDLTHTSLPAPPWEIEEGNVDALVLRTLTRKEQLYARKLRERSIEWYRRRYEQILAQLKDRDRVVERLAHAVQPLGQLPYEPSWRCVNVDTDSRRWVVLAWADHHVGKVVYRDAVNADNEYNAEVYAQRMRLLSARVGELVRCLGFALEGLYIMDLGDTFDNPNSSTYPHQERLQDVYETDAITLSLRAVRDFLLDMLGLFPVVRVRSVRGNHGFRGRALSGWYDELLWNPILSCLFEQDNRVEIRTSRKDSMAEVIGNSLFVLTHGSTVGRGAIRRELDVMRRVMTHWEGRTKWRYLLMGHLHHRAWGGQPYSLESQYEWILCPSLVGSNAYGERVTGCTSRPAQRLFVVHPDRGIELTADLYLD